MIYNKENVIEIDTSELSFPESGTDLYTSRQNAVKSYPDNVLATISVVAYNRLEETKLCIESILKNTRDINYKLILLYNDSESGKGILEYFKSVEFENKLVIHVTKNLGAPFATSNIIKYIEGKYFIPLVNDLIVAPNWLTNLIKCAESDNSIGMVTPVSSNVSNHQLVDLKFSNYDELQTAAGNYNTSNQKEWHERLRLITIGSMFTRECLEAIGTVLDTGFFHDFGDDDVSFRVRRAGYKCILAKDTWIHHNHDFSSRDQTKMINSLNSGRKNFQDKYYGIDAWDDVDYCCLLFLNDHISKPSSSENVSILGIDTKCGQPILDIKNRLRDFDIFDSTTNAFTQDAKYMIDLQTVCGADHVVCSNSETLRNHYTNDSFDYIIIGKSINSYHNYKNVIKSAYSLLKSNGQLFLSLRNTNDIHTLSSMLGYLSNIENEVVNCSVDNFFIAIEKLGIDIELVNKENYQVNSDIIDAATQILKMTSNASNVDGLLSRLTTKDYWFKIVK